MPEIQLTRGFVAIVDPVDVEFVRATGSWHAHMSGGRRIYAAKSVRRAGRNGQLFMHNLLTGLDYVDHVNGNGLDNRRSNLRPATPSLNRANGGLDRNNTSGFKGVSFKVDRGRWRAYIKVNGLRRHLGYFDTAEEAARVYDAAAIEAWGEFARPNFPSLDTTKGNKP